MDTIWSNNQKCTDMRLARVPLRIAAKCGHPQATHLTGPMKKSGCFKRDNFKLKL